MPQGWTLVQPAAATQPPDPPSGWTLIAPAERSGSALTRIGDALPNVGGMVGSVVGGIPGAALGGAAGRGYGTLLQRGREIPGAVADVARNLIAQPRATVGGGLRGIAEGAGDALAAGAVQGGVEAVGRGIVRPVAKTIYGVALRPIKSLRDKYGLRTLIKEGFERGVLPTKGGAARATRAMQASRATQRGLAEAYDTAGEALSVPAAAGRGVRPILQKIEQQELATGTTGGPKRVMAQMRRLFKRHPQPIPATEMLDLKHAADELADPAFALARRTGVSVPTGSRASVAKGLSKGYRELLNETVGPEFAKQGLTTKALYGVGRMADYAAERQEALANYFALISGGIGTAGSGGDIGAGIKSALISRALLSPRVQAGTALTMTPLALYGTRGADVLTGLNVEQMMREALKQRLTGRQ